LLSHYLHIINNVVIARLEIFSCFNVCRNWQKKMSQLLDFENCERFPYFLIPDSFDKDFEFVTELK